MRELVSMGLVESSRPGEGERLETEAYTTLHCHYRW